MAAVIGSIREDGSDGGGADVSGREEEREALVRVSVTRLACTCGGFRARREERRARERERERASGSRSSE